MKTSTIAVLLLVVALLTTSIGIAAAEAPEKTSGNTPDDAGLGPKYRNPDCPNRTPEGDEHHFGW